MEDEIKELREKIRVLEKTNKKLDKYCNRQGDMIDMLEDYCRRATFYCDICDTPGFIEDCIDAYDVCGCDEIGFCSEECQRKHKCNSPSEY